MDTHEFTVTHSIARLVCRTVYDLPPRQRVFTVWRYLLREKAIVRRPDWQNFRGAPLYLKLFHAPVKGDGYVFWLDGDDA